MSTCLLQGKLVFKNMFQNGLVLQRKHFRYSAVKGDTIHPSICNGLTAFYIQSARLLIGFHGSEQAKVGDKRSGCLVRRKASCLTLQFFPHAQALITPRHSVPHGNQRRRRRRTKAKVHMSLETRWDFSMLNIDIHSNLWHNEPMTICFQHCFKMSRELRAGGEVVSGEKSPCRTQTYHSLAEARVNSS